MKDLSKIRPDRDDFVEQLEQILATKDSWKDRVVSSTGRTLVDLVAAVGAYSQYSIESAYQEVWPESSKNKESLYAAANFAGVRVNRKSPNRLVAELVSVAPQTIPPFSQFSVNGTFWFNRTPLNLTTTPTEFDLYQGQVVTHTMSGIGVNFQAFVSPETGFAVSDTDVQVYLNGGAIPTIQAGLWTVLGEPGVQQFTLPTGQAIFLFGSEYYGSKPDVNDEVEIVYVVTFGADGNNLPVVNQSINLDDDNSVSGSVISIASEGTNETDPFVYKNITPALFGAFDSAVTPAQYKALPLQYPGVIDAQTFAQREINPKALTWMNNVRVVLLTTVPFTNMQWNAFTAFMQSKTMYKCQLIRKDPVAVPVNVELDVYCANFSDLSDVKTKVEEAIEELFAPRQGILGFDFYRSDIERVVDDADPNIEYLVLKTPSTDVIISSLNVEQPTLTEEGGGTLAAGTYDYAISVVSTLGGETAPANWSSITVTGSGNQVKLDWTAVPNAANYKIWGRVTGSALGLIATVAGNVVTYTDTGAITPSGTVPVEATIDSYYAELGTLTVNTFYSTRPIRIDNND
jgi:hypothetical protein